MGLEVVVKSWLIRPHERRKFPSLAHMWIRRALWSFFQVSQSFFVCRVVRHHHPNPNVQGFFSCQKLLEFGELCTLSWKWWSSVILHVKVFSQNSTLVIFSLFSPLFLSQKRRSLHFTSTSEKGEKNHWKIRRHFI